MFEHIHEIQYIQLSVVIWDNIFILILVIKMSTHGFSCVPMTGFKFRAKNRAEKLATEMYKLM